MKLSFLQSLNMWAKVLCGLVVVTFLLAMGVGAVPALAQSSNNPYSLQHQGDSLGFQWSQNSSTPDELLFYGADSLHSVDGKRLADQILNILDSAQSPAYWQDVYDDYSNSPPTRLRTDLEHHFLTAANSWHYVFDTAAIASVARAAGYQSVTMDVCALDGLATVAGTAEPNDEFDGCKSWTFSTQLIARQPGSIDVVENPSASHYWSVVTVFGAVVLLFVALFGGFAHVLRRKALETLGSTNIVLAIIGVVVAATSITITAGVFGFGVHSVDDMLLVHEWGVKQHALLIAAPAVLSALPLLLASILLVRVEPRLAEAPVQQTRTRGGIPSWMLDTSASASSPSAEPSPVAPSVSDPQALQHPPPFWNPPT